MTVGADVASIPMPDVPDKEDMVAALTSLSANCLNTAQHLHQHGTRDNVCPQRTYSEFDQGY